MTGSWGAGMGDAGYYRRFDAPDIAPGERFEYWRTWYGETVDGPVRLDPVPSSLPGFTSSAQVLTVGDVTIVDLHCGPVLGSWRGRAADPTDALRLSMIYAAPGAVIRWGGLDSPVRGRRALLAGGTPGQWRAPSGLRTIQVCVPRATVPATDAMLHRATSGPLQPGVAVFDTLIGPALAGMAGRVEDLSRTATADLGTLWVSMITMLVHALNDGEPGDLEAAPARMHAARHFIAAHLDDPDLSPDVVAAALHVSRRTLYNVVGGDGVAHEIRSQRLERALRLLLDPCHRQRSISEIAAMVGLRSGAQFCRQFRAEYGRTASNVRASATRRDPTPPATHQSPLDIGHGSRMSCCARSARGGSP